MLLRASRLPLASKSLVDCWVSALNQLTKTDKSNTTEYYVYDYQGNRVRSVVESNNQVQSQRDYLPLLDISTNQPFLLDLGFVFASDDGGTTIGVVVFVTEGLGFVAQLQG
jgi:hypothetical protein